jgi:hypothetical protein
MRLVLHRELFRLNRKSCVNRRSSRGSIPGQERVLDYAIKGGHPGSNFNGSKFKLCRFLPNDPSATVARLGRPATWRRRR